MKLCNVVMQYELLCDLFKSLNTINILNSIHIETILSFMKHYVSRIQVFLFSIMRALTLLLYYYHKIICIFHLYKNFNLFNYYMEIRYRQQCTNCDLLLIHIEDREIEKCLYFCDTFDTCLISTRRYRQQFDT